MTSATIGVEKIGIHVPPGRQKVSDLLSLVGASVNQGKFLERIHQLREVPIADPGEQLPRFLCRAIDDLGSREALQGVELVLYAHSTLAQVPASYHLMERILTEAGLSGTPAYGISQLNCASGILAMEVLARYLEKRPEGTKALLLTGDLTSFLPEARYLKHSTVMGDSASALVFSRGHCRNQLLSTAVTYDTRFHEGFYIDEEGWRAFGKSCLPNLERAILQALGKAGLTLADVDWILPHNVNTTTWSRFCQTTGFDPAKLYTELIPQLGHSYCNDGPLNLWGMREAGMMQRGDYFLMVSVGVGSYFAAAVFRH